ncbi:OsmC family protein [Ruania albidiflava]|uniref:OsmC family protein n=1 Tax=Ruania albidiflava TaxID=366586 RepID=UPI0023F17231|nr:OsmC family protein [Ruania albidiflava]
MAKHEYTATIVWSGSTGGGYRSFSREHTASLTATEDLMLSADAAFRGDADRTNPEQLVVLAASSCQMLSFLGAAARVGVDVVSYEDSARGSMPLKPVPVSITEIELRPLIRVRGAEHGFVNDLVHQAHEHCYIANSLRGEVRVIPAIEVIA